MANLTEQPTDGRTVNVLISSFPGLGLPRTLSLQLSPKDSICELSKLLKSSIPNVKNRLLLTTNSNKLLNPTSPEPLSSLLGSENDTLLPLRLSAPMCGGKGGFGSQLRAAGGKMSSRKRKGEANNGSNRNLDGRRLRSVAEAKALAEYLALKPEMDRKEKEERRRRWEQVIEMAEAKEQEFKDGSAKVRLDGKWVEAKEESETKTREAILKALEEGKIDVAMRESDESPSGSEEDGSESEAEAEVQAESSKGKQSTARTFHGWDDDDEFMSEEEDEDEEDEPAVEAADPKGKGKARA